MISIWSIILILLIIEITINFILVQPFLSFIRKAICSLLRLLFKPTVVKVVSIVFAVILLYAFGYSYYTQVRLTEEVDSQASVIMDATKELTLRVRIFREQRNMYLSGLAFFHGIVLWRIVKLYKHFDENQEKAKHDNRELNVNNNNNKSEENNEKEIKKD